MQIRTRLSLYFTLISSFLMLLVMAFIYLLFVDAGTKDFYTALHERTERAAGVYLEADEIPDSSLQRIKEKYIVTLPQEVIRFYDSTDQPSFIKDKNRNWNSNIINEVRKKKYIEYKDGPRQVVGILYDDNQGSFVILASAVDVYGKERRQNLIKIMAAIFVVQILIQFLAGRWFVTNMLLPIQKVNDQVQKINATDLHLRVDGGKGKDEISMLAINFNQLLARLEHSFDMQRMFVSNASHELKTPVTSIIGEIEVAVSKERTGDEYKKTLQSTLTEAERLHTIINNFLLLANAENGFTQKQVETVRLDELLWELQEIFKHEGGHVLQIVMDNLPQNEGQLCIQANKVLLLLAFRNVIRNAFKFSDNKPVLSTLRATEQAITISIADKGIGITSASLQKIFEPFYRSPQTQQYDGYGIGLYIARKIIELYGGYIDVTSEEGHGSTFNIIFGQK